MSESTPFCTYGHASHQGLVREQNQDAVGRFPREHCDPRQPGGVLFVVADGMGGHVGGREASQMAVHELERAYFDRITHNSDPATALRKAIQAVNHRIYERARQEPELHGMGTTCTALLLHGHQALIAHVGDSRGYLVTPDQIRQITTDHTYVETMVRLQMVSEEEAAHHAQRHVLSRAVGVEANVDVDLYPDLPVQTGSAFVLCSDGLAEVTEEEIRKTVLKLEPQQACDQLVQMALERGGKDNVTVQVVRINQTPHVEPEVDKKTVVIVVTLLLVVLALVVGFFYF